MSVEVKGEHNHGWFLSIQIKEQFEIEHELELISNL